MNPAWIGTVAGIYPILDAQWLGGDIPGTGQAFSPVAIAKHLATLPVKVVQLRCKSNAQMAFAFLSLWVNLLRDHCPEIKIIINDWVELALILKADGVHVGQDDLPITQCRNLLGSERILGLSTHSLAEIRVAQTMEVDYVGFGPVFGTLTKSDTQAIQGVDGLASVVKESSLPIVAIGGITQARIPATAKAGAAAVAMISDLWRADWSRRLALACQTWLECH